MCFDDEPLKNLLVHLEGVSYPSDGRPPIFSLCTDSHYSLKTHKPLSNKLCLGNVPPELKNPTVIEGAMIAFRRLSTGSFSSLDAACHYLSSTVLKITEVLPPSIEEITPIYVLFIGSSPPTAEWLRAHAKPSHQMPIVYVVPISG
ncbi:hypothetical protein C8R45DRAFT_943418 [Mycena sanguinolenta]|nr:hypothetical protein C8R45DRAFT_943418 [Mycena sanguinolenta]